MRNFFIYILTMGITLYVMAMYNQKTLFMLFIFELIVLILDICLVIYLRFKITGECILSSRHMEKGRPICIEIHLNNPTLIPVMNLKLSMRYTYGFSTEKHRVMVIGNVDSKSKEVLTCEVTSQYCGCVDFDNVKLKIYDLFSLFPLTVKIGKGFQAAILPNIYETDIVIGSRTRNLVGESDTYSKDKSGDDPSEVFKIREYSRGDKLQNIHWKITARKDKTMVKEFSRPIGYNVILLMDINQKHLTKNPLETIDRLLESVISIANSLLEADCFFSLSWVDGAQSGIVRRQIDNIDALYEAMEEIIHLCICRYDTDIVELYKESYGTSDQKTWMVIDMNLNIYINGTKEYQIGQEPLNKSLAELHIII